MRYLVIYDDLGARQGNLIGLVEGREATAPFTPEAGAVRLLQRGHPGAVDFRPIAPVE